MRISDWSSDVCSSDLAGRAVTFAAQIFGRVPAAIVVEPEPDELGDRFRVLGEAPEILGVGLAERVAEAGADRVYEDDVRDVEKALGVVDDGIGRCARIERETGGERGGEGE